MSEPRSFRFEIDRSTRVARITLDRPERLNALTFEVYAELRDLFARLDTEPGVGAVVLTGSGRAFCSGGDVEDIIGALFSRDAEGLRAFTRMTCDLILNIRRCRRPVVAALNGTVAGAGAVIAAACDFRIAAESAKIAFLFVRVGLSGADMGASWLLPRLVGLGRASDWLLQGATVSAQEALAAGLVTRVIPGEQLLAEAKAVARRLADAPREATAVTKRLLDRESSMTFDQAIRAEGAAQSALMQKDDFREAYRAFMEKREPRFNR